MPRLHVTVERFVNAPPALVYRCVSDFLDHHGRYLPPQFTQYRVEEGGDGAGTVVSFTSTLGGRPRAFRVRVEEPVPGRVLLEADTLSDLVTTTTITPDGEGCRVRLETVWSSAPGALGLLERLFAPAMMRRLYADEIARLERYAQELAPQPTARLARP